MWIDPWLPTGDYQARFTPGRINAAAESRLSEKTGLPNRHSNAIELTQADRGRLLWRETACGDQE